MLACECSNTYFCTCSRVQPDFLMVWECSPANTIAYCGCLAVPADIRICAQNVSRMPCASALSWFEIWCGASAAKTVTTF
jgi:hypothetical protein